MKVPEIFTGRKVRFQIYLKESDVKFIYLFFLGDLKRKTLQNSRKALADLKLLNFSLRNVTAILEVLAIP